MTTGFFFETIYIYIKLASRLIKNLPVPLGTLVRKRVRQKLAAVRSTTIYNQPEGCELEMQVAQHPRKTSHHVNLPMTTGS
jgi:hypothetical protein